ncbi:WhiB family transcriptional regulator [Streptomyces albipurpureus]|uniref:Transcriptional regulator WhiB n=1 Tax=Streptomyces albipurpureus TaxID=2897419 RepID=A0ABT0UQ04_9ACTN|nr:WhiB family transcriptional regulator [Streptomyces sp. CWNU-1]MCM2390688.1 WhiB family transcriptional regulator [Streptomyces sp. CWNU-1]
MEWQRDAACVSEDPELFFPISAVGPDAEQVDRARQVCERCPVADACYDWAKSTGQRSGVWGGVNATQRRSVSYDGPYGPPQRAAVH